MWDHKRERARRLTEWGLILPFFTRDGWLTRYALACGYIEKSGTPEAYVTLEQISSNGTLRVHVGGRWAREDIYLGSDLKTARRWFRNACAKARNNTWQERCGG